MDWFEVAKEIVVQNDRDLIKDECRGCGVDINENEIEAYGHQCRRCFRNSFQSDE